MAKFRLKKWWNRIIFFWMIISVVLLSSLFWAAYALVLSVNGFENIPISKSSIVSSVSALIGESLAYEQNDRTATLQNISQDLFRIKAEAILRGSFATLDDVERAIDTALKERPLSIISIPGQDPTLDARFTTLANALRAEIASVADSAEGRTVIVERAVALTNNIDQLNGVVIRNATIDCTLEGLTDAHIPNNITVSGYLPTSGGTIAGSLTVEGAVTLSSFSATSTTATSTIAGGLTVDTDTVLVDFSTNRIGVSTTTPTEQFAVANRIYVGGTGTSTFENNLFVGGAVEIGTACINCGGGGSFSGGALSATSITDTGALNVLGLTTLINASTTRLSVFDTAYFGGTATSTFTSAGAFNLAGILTGTNTGTSTFAGDLTAHGFAATDYLIPPRIHAPSTTATSTFAGGLTVTGAFTSDYTSTSTFNGGLSATYLNLTGTAATSTFAGGLTFVSGGNVNLAANGVVLINDAQTLSATTLGSSVVNSSLTSVGTLTSLNLSGAITNTANATSTFTGDIHARGITAGNYLTTPFISATSTTATSTFAGNVRVDNNLQVGSGTTYLFSTATSTFGGGITSAKNIELATGGAFTINGAAVLDNDTLGTLVVNSSLTSVGVLATGSIGGSFGAINIGANALTAGAGSFSTISASSISSLLGGFVSSASSSVTTLQGRNLFASSTIVADGQALFALTGGSVGIGTTTPTYLLDVDGDFRVGVQGAAANTLFVDTSIGNVGIGTTSPWAKLTVAFDDASTNNASATPMFAVSQGEGYLPYPFYIGTISEGGSIGIGTENPSKTLHIVGGLQIDAGWSISTLVAGPSQSSGALTADESFPYGLTFKPDGTA